MGGAVISTPGIRVLGASAFVAVGTTLPAILPSAAVGTARYAREGLVDWPVVVATAPTGIVAAVAGSYASHAVPGNGHLLMVLTAAILAFTAWRMAHDDRDERSAEEQEREPEVVEGPRSRTLGGGAAIGAVAGTLSGLLGVGGGVVLVPGFSQLLRLPLKTSIATSLACVGVLAVPSTVSHALLGDIDWRMALLLAVAVVPGSRLGAVLSIRAADRRLRLAVAAFLGVIAVAYGVGEISAVLR